MFYLTLTAVVAGVAYWELRGRDDDVDRAGDSSGLLTLAAAAVVVTIGGVLWLLR